MKSGTDVNFDNNDEQYVDAGGLSAGRQPFRSSGGISTRSSAVRRSCRRPHNILTIQPRICPYRNRRAQTAAFGDTQVFGANMVNAFRVTWANTRTRANDPPEKFFDAASLGIPNVYTYVPGTMTVIVGATGNDFRFSGTTRSRRM